MNNVSDRARPSPDRRKELLKLFNALAPRHGAWQVFSDFAEAAAISISNAVDRTQRESREQRYMELIKRYKPEELAMFPRMLAEVTLELEEEISDVLGRTFHELELHNKWAGQFFSPYTLCRMMAKMTLGDEETLRAKIAQRGYVTAQEPACGSGAMAIALAHEMKDLGVNYQQHLHVTAIDIDLKCVHMAYVQFSLLHIPAVVVHGNTLSLEEFGRWYTPAHVLGGWDWKLCKAHEADLVHEVQDIPAAPHPPQPQEPPRRDENPPMQLTLF